MHNHEHTHKKDRQKNNQLNKFQNVKESANGKSKY